MEPNQPSTPAQEAWTVQRILLWTTGFLKQKGIESPRLEAELLLAHARKCARIRLYTEFESIVSDDERAVMREMVQRRAKREPLAYIVGSKEFYGRNFDVGKGVLIPRPETETLVDICLDSIPKDSPSHIIEVGFGSGCIAITLAKQRDQCHVTATDVSSDAMRFALQNVAKHAVESQVRLLQGDCLAPVQSLAAVDPDLLFDGLVSNPPYVRDDEMATLQPEVGQHEPHTALQAGSDGLDIVRRLVRHAAELLKPAAFVALELDPEQCAVVAELLECSGFSDAHIHKDLSGLNRIVTAVRAA